MKSVGTAFVSACTDGEFHTLADPCVLIALSGPQGY